MMYACSHFAHSRLLRLWLLLIRKLNTGSSQCRQVEVLLAVRGGEHEKRTSEDDPEALERVSTVVG